MTCAEFRAMRGRGHEVATVALVDAMATHVLQCPACDEFCEEIYARLPPDRVAAVNRMTEHFAANILAEDVPTAGYAGAAAGDLGVGSAGRVADLRRRYGVAD
jgi:hypothetical protein